MKAAEPVESRIEQARQFRATQTRTDAASRGAETTTGSSAMGSQDESFGVQQILKREEKLRPFNAFADVSAFYTNNVALTHRGGESDAFLAATFGLSYQRPLTDALRANFTLKGGIFRYDKFSQLDFNSLDTGAGLTYRLKQLADIDLFVGYNFTDLFSGHGGDKFFQNHAVTLGAEKTFPLSHAHGITIGASATFSSADPSSAERNEYSAYAGYRLEMTQHLSSDVVYRFSYQDYSEENRHDFNNSIALTLRYEVAKWLDLNGTAYFSDNSSNDRTFSYDVFNGGGGIGANIRF